MSPAVHLTVAEKPARPAFVYLHGDGLYVNLTNRCPVSCTFCIKRALGMRFEGRDLRLAAEPSVREILQALGDSDRFQEIVFCGYGEPTYRLKELLEIAGVLKARRLAAGLSWPRIRLNTVGLGNLINGRDIVIDLAGRVDAVSISLNTAYPDQWRRLHHPLREFHADGFGAVLHFIRRCVELLPETVVTAVALPGVDLCRCEVLARSLGAQFRIRPLIGQ